MSINEILSNPNLANGDEISHIVDDAGKLRQYLIESYNTAQTKYVLLGGDSTIIPIRYCYSKNINIPCDFYYSELNSNWDTNNNGLYGEYSDYVDYGAEIYVGRLLCNSNDEVKNWTKKLLQYELNPGNGDSSYLGRALFTQGDQMQRDSEAESVRQALQGNISCTILNEYPAYDSPNTTAPLGYDVIDSINTIHYGLLGNFNHGTALSYTTATNTLNRSHNAHHAICAMDFYDTHDEWLYNNIPDENNGFDNLTNSIYPAVFYSISCTNMPFDMYNTFEGTINLGRSFTCHNIGGGPAYLGNTRSGYVTSSTRLFCSFVDSIINNIRNNHLGITEAKSKFGYRNNYLRHCHNLLGCPEMS